MDCDVLEMCLGNSGEVSIVLYYVVQVSNGVYEFFFFCYMVLFS